MCPSDIFALLSIVAIAAVLIKGFRGVGRIPPRKGPPNRITEWH